MNSDGIPVSVHDGFLESFAEPFLETFGRESLFVRTVSDLWTIALARGLIDKGEMDDMVSVPLFSDDVALTELRILLGDLSLKQALLQEPMGFADPGTIEKVFDSLYGDGSFSYWLSAFERREFTECRKVTTPDG